MRHQTVREIMSCVRTCQQPPGASVRDGCRLMAEHRCGSVLVVEGSRLLGIFTQRDAIERVFACGLDPDLTVLAEVMTREPDTIGPNQRVDEAIRRMDEFGYRHLPVVDGREVVGVLSIRDLSIEDLAAMHAELESRRTIAERAW
ncbi:MAG TPA: CBS domain-containing protein [Geminicoccaceae bacterium]|nr:CBS domain-containing protein [Geminicoccaceae bacterium]